MLLTRLLTLLCGLTLVAFGILGHLLLAEGQRLFGILPTSTPLGVLYYFTGAALMYAAFSRPFIYAIPTTVAVVYGILGFGAYVLPSLEVFRLLALRETNILLFLAVTLLVFPWQTSPKR